MRVPSGAWARSGRRRRAARRGATPRAAACWPLAGTCGLASRRLPTGALRSRLAIRTASTCRTHHPLLHPRRPRRCRRWRPLSRPSATSIALRRSRRRRIAS
eukprot:4960928-Prymnesium_polylepis.1